MYAALTMALERFRNLDGSLQLLELTGNGGRALCLKHFHSSVVRNQRNEKDEDLLFDCLLPLLCPSSPSYVTHDRSHGDFWAPPSRLTYAAESSHKHHQTLDIHAKVSKVSFPKLRAEFFVFSFEILVVCVFSGH